MTVIRIVKTTTSTPQAQPQVPVQTPVSQAKPVVPKLKVKEVGGRRWWLVGLGAVLAVAGFGGFGYFASHPNNFIGMVSVITILGAGICIWYGIKKQDSGVVVLNASGKPITKNQPIGNCLNIRPLGVSFETLPDNELLGLQPRKCLNDNKYYFVHIWDTAWGNPKPDGKFIQFSLPDTQYRDPREFANNINIPAHRRLAQRKANLFEKLSPALLIVAIVIVGIIWVATTPAPVTP